MELTQEEISKMDNIVISDDDIANMDAVLNRGNNKNALENNNVDISVNVPEINGELATNQNDIDKISTMIFTPDELAEMDKAEPIGWIEAFQKLKPNQYVPFGTGKQAYDIARVLSIGNKLEKTGEMAPSDKEFIHDYMRTQIELSKRGLSWGGNLSYYGAQLPAFMIEFGATGGIGKVAGKTAVKAAAKVAQKALIKGLAKKTLIKTAGATANIAARTVVMPQRVAVNYAQRRISDGLNITDKGEVIIEEATEKPALTYVKALSSTAISVGSELAGGLIIGGVNKVGKVAGKPLVSGFNLLPSAVQKELTKFIAKVRPNETVANVFKNGGYNGIFAEYGEERLDALLQTAFGLDSEEGTTFDQLVGALFPEKEQALLELGLFSIMGGGSAAASIIANNLTKKGYDQKEITEILDNTTENEKDNMVAALEGDNIDVEQFDEVLDDSPMILEGKVSADKETLIDNLKARTQDKLDLLVDDKTVTLDEVEAGVIELDAKFGSVVSSKEEIEVKAEQKDVAYAGIRDILSQTVYGKDKKLTNSAITKLINTGNITDLMDDIEANADVTDTVVGENRLTEFFGVNKDDSSVEVLDKLLKGLDSGVIDEDVQRDRQLEIIKKEFNSAKTVQQKDIVTMAAYNWIENQPTEMHEQLITDLGLDDTKAIQTVKAYKSNVETAIKAFKGGLKKGITQTKEDVKSVQDSLVDFINDSNLNTADKGKFLATVKNIQTVAQLEKALPKIEARIDDIITNAENKKLVARYKKKLNTKIVVNGKSKLSANETAILEKLKGRREVNYDIAEADLSNFEKLQNLTIQLKEGIKLPNSVLKDMNKQIDAILKAGRENKNIEDAIAQINRSELVDKALDALSKSQDYKNKKLKLLTDIGFTSVSELFSQLNTIFTKELADELDLSVVGNKKSQVIFKKKEEVRKGVEKIYGTLSKKDKLFYVDAITKVLHEFNNRDSISITEKGINPITYELRPLEIIDLYNAYNSDDNTKKNMLRTFKEDDLQHIFNTLTDKDEQFADLLHDLAGADYEALNKLSLELNGVALPKIDNYWMRSSEREGEANLMQTYFSKSEKGSSMQKRANKVIVKPTNALEKFNKHSVEVAHLLNVSKQYKKIKDLLSDRNVKQQIIKKYGEKAYNSLMENVESNSINYQSEKVSGVIKLLNTALSNWSSSVLFSGAVAVKQQTSRFIYLTYLKKRAGKSDSLTWHKYHAESLNPLKVKNIYDYMFKNSGLIQERYAKGYDDASRMALQEAGYAQSLPARVRRFNTSLTRMSDINAIVNGGYAYVKTRINQGLSEVEAFKEFEKLTLKTQQSGEINDMSLYQSNPNLKFLTLFKNTVFQYVRLLDTSTQQWKRGEITNEEYSDVVLMMGVIQPAVYAGLGVIMSTAWKNVFGDNEEYDATVIGAEMLLQIATQGLSIFPYAADILRDQLRGALDLRRYNNIFSEPLTDDIEKAIRISKKKRKDDYDIAEMASLLLAPITALPLPKVVRTLKRMNE